MLHAGLSSLGSRSQSRLAPGYSCFQDKPCTDRESAHERQHSNARQVSADRHQEETICFGGTMSSTSQTHQALGKASGGVTPGAPKHPSQPHADTSPSHQWEQDHSGSYRDPSPSVHMGTQVWNHAQTTRAAAPGMRKQCRGKTSLRQGKQ